MSRETTYAGMLGEWERWITALLANVTDLGHLEVPRVELAGKLAQARQLIQTQSELIAAKQDASKDLRETMIEGQRLATVLKVSVRQFYGIDSEKLAEFGIQPFRGRFRKTVKPPPVE